MDKGHQKCSLSSGRIVSSSGANAFKKHSVSLLNVRTHYNLIIMKNLIYLILIVLPSYSFGQADFIATFQSDNNGFSNNQSVTFPIESASGYQVDFNNDGDLLDAGESTIHTTNFTHDFGVVGTHTIRIVGNLDRIFFDNSDANDRHKILSIDQWGTTSVWTTMNNAFHGCINLSVPATDAPNFSICTDLTQMFDRALILNSPMDHWDVSNITIMANMFRDAGNFNQPLNNWNVSSVTSMQNMFINAINFNQPLNNWNVSSVTTMNGLFRNVTDFNQPLDGWDMSNVRNTSSMFRGTTSFNQPLNTWDVSSDTIMKHMFRDADSFNQSLDTWDVSNVNDMGFMFNGNDIFNQPLNMWNVSKVTAMNKMFESAAKFDQSLGDWDMSSVSNLLDIFNNASFSTVSYDSTLIGWSSQTLMTGLTLGTISVQYCNSATERQKIIDDFTWTINDGGQGNCGDMTWNGTSWSPFTPISLNNAIVNGTYDITTNGDISSNGLTINASQTLTMTSGNINLTGNFDNNGNAFSQTGGTVTFNGSSAQTIDGNNSFDDIVINNAAGVSLNAATAVTGVLTLTSGTLASGGNLSLKSTASGAGGTATIDFSGSGTISGNVTQERFLDGATQRGYRYITPAVTGQTLASIHDDVTLNQLGSVYSPSTNESTYTNSYSPLPNIFYYDQSLVKAGMISQGHLNGQAFNQALIGWEIPSATSDLLSPGTGIALNIGAADETIAFTGPLQTTNIVLSLAHGGQTNSGWHLVGNPFAATLDWNAVYEDGDNSGVEPTAYVFDANGEFSGTYASFNAATDADVNGGVKDIASGQAFFIQTTSGMAGDVTMKTSHTSSTDVTFHRTQKTDRGDLCWKGEVRLHLIDEQGAKDELLLYFIDEAQDGKDFGDAKKFFGAAYGLPELASKAFGYELLMDCRNPADQEIQSFDLVVKSGTAGNYTLKAASIAQFAVGTEIYLEDRVENVMINLNQVTDYQFEIIENEKAIADRFQVHVRINRVTSIEDDLKAQDISLFAHNKQVHIQFSNASADKSQIVIYDLMGRLIYHQTNESNVALSIPISKNGVYVVKIENQDGMISKKIIIQ